MAALGTSNITTTLVKNTLGENSRDVGTLCSSDKINVESKHKPIFRSGTQGVTDSELENANYGFSDTIIDGFDNYSQEFMNNPDQYLTDWPYKKPTGMGTAPFRLGDFRGYDHTAKFKEGDWGVVDIDWKCDTQDINGVTCIKAQDLLNNTPTITFGFKDGIKDTNVVHPQLLSYTDLTVSNRKTGWFSIQTLKRIPYKEEYKEWQNIINKDSTQTVSEFVDNETENFVAPLRNKDGQSTGDLAITQDFIDNHEALYMKTIQYIWFGWDLLVVGHPDAVVMPISATGGGHVKEYIIDGGAYGYVDGVRISQAFSDNGTNDGWMIEGYMNCLPAGDRNYNGGTVVTIPSFHYWYGYVQEDGTYFASNYQGDIYASKKSLMSMDTGRQLIRANMIKNSDFRINAAGGFCVSAGGNPNFNNSQALKSEVATLDTTNLEIGNTKDSGLWIVGKATRDGNAIEFTAEFRNTYKFYNASSTQTIEVGECCVYFKKMSNPMPNSSTDIYDADEAKYTFDVGTLTGSTSRKICTWSIPTAYASNNYYAYLITPNHGKYYCKINNA